MDLHGSTNLEWRNRGIAKGIKATCHLPVCNQFTTVRRKSKPSKRYCDSYLASLWLSYNLPIMFFLPVWLRNIYPSSLALFFFPLSIRWMLMVQGQVFFWSFLQWSLLLHWLSWIPMTVCLVEKSMEMYPLCTRMLELMRMHGSHRRSVNILACFLWVIARPRIQCRRFHSR